MTRAAGLGILALAILPSVALGATASKPKPARVALSFQRRASAKTCPSEKELRRQVTSILGYQPFDRHAKRVMACVLWADKTTLHARLRLSDAKTGKSLGLRELSATGPGCQELGSAVALAIALAIDPLAKPPAPHPVEQRAAAPPPPPRPAERHVTAPPAVTPPSLSVGAGATAAAPIRVDQGTAAVPPPPAAAPPVGTAAEVPVALLDAGPEPAVAAQRPDAGPPPAVSTADAGLEATVVVVVPPVVAAPDAGAPLAMNAQPDAGPPPVPPKVEAPPEPPPAAAAAASTEEPRPFYGLAGAGADWTINLVPRRAFGVDVHGGVAWSFASVEFEARWLPSTSFNYNGGSISSRLVTGAVVGCALFGDWGACGLIQAGPLRSQGSGYQDSLNATTWVVAVGARGQWDWVFAHPVGLRLHADGLVNLVRPRLLVNSAVAWEAPPLALVVGAGLYVVF
jgi:hypothetical protein